MSSPDGDDISPEERAEYRQVLRRAKALPDVAGIAGMRAAALRHPRPGVSDAEVYADEAFLLGHLAEPRKLLGQLEALFGEPAALAATGLGEPPAAIACPAATAERIRRSRNWQEERQARASGSVARLWAASGR